MSAKSVRSASGFYVFLTFIKIRKFENELNFFLLILHLAIRQGYTAHIQYAS